MDPYVLIEFKGNKYKTKTHQNGGKTPKWNHVRILKDADESDLMFRILL